MSDSTGHGGASRGLARNVLNLLMGQVATTALTIFLAAAVGRTLGPSDFGILYLISAVATFTFVFVDWGHGTYIIREVARHPERTGELMGTALAVRTVTAVCLIGPAVLSGWLLGYPPRTLALIAGNILASLPIYLGLSFGWAFRGKERMELDALIGIVLKFLALVFGVAVLHNGGRIPALLAGQAVAGLITLAIAAFIYHRLELGQLQVTWAMARELVFGGASMVTMTVAVAFQPYLDANMLSRLSTPAVMGWYGAASAFTNTLIAPAFVLASATYPRLSVAAARPGGLRPLLRDALRPLMCVAVYGAVGTFLFADVAVGIIYSREKFAPTATILRAFAPAMMLVYLDMMLGTAILAAGNALRLATAKIVSIVVIGAVEIVLIPWCQAHYGNGAIAVMIAFAVGELVMVAASLYLLPRGTLHASIGLDLARALAAGAGTVLVLRPLIHLSPFATVPLSAAAFIGFAMLFGLIKRTDLALLTKFPGRRSVAAPDPVAPVPQSASRG
jgi:O-antigen/teichoic acid export membrane protein